MGDLLDAGLRVLALHPNQARVGVVAPSVLTTESALRVSTALARHDARRVSDVESKTCVWRITFSTLLASRPVGRSCRGAL